jgi:hypothetical protein
MPQLRGHRRFAPGFEYYLYVTRNESYNYEWSTGGENYYIKATGPGKFSCRVRNENGCEETGYFEVMSIDSINLRVIGDNLLCGEDDEAILTIAAEPMPRSQDYQLIWPDGSRGDTFRTNKEGDYNLIVDFFDYCTRDVPFKVRRGVPATLELNLEGKAEVCVRENFTLEILDYEPENNYFLNGYSIGKKVSISEDGKYSVTAINPDGCEITKEIEITLIQKPRSIIISDKGFISCDGSPVKLSSDIILNNLAYYWNGVISGPEITVNKSGEYELIVEDLETGCSDTSVAKVQFIEKIIPEISGNFVICDGNPALLKLESIPGINMDNVTILWSEGNTGRFCLAEKPGEYWVSVKTPEGCEGSDTITIREGEIPVIPLKSDSIFLCGSDRVYYEYPEINENFEYIWTDGIESPGREISGPGTYLLEIYNEAGCRDTFRLEVNQFSDLNLEIIAENDTIGCDPGFIELTARCDGNPEFTWSTGENSGSIIISEPGEYSVIANDSKYCPDTAFISIHKYPEAVAGIIADKDFICKNEPIQLTSEFEARKYAWSTGESTREITVTQAGNYTLIAENPGGCLDTAQITIENGAPGIEISPRQIDLTHRCGDEIPRISINIINSGTEPFLLEKPGFREGLHFKFAENITFPVQVFPGGEFALEIIPLLNKSGKFSDILEIELGGRCEITDSVYLNSEIIPEYNFEIPDYTIGSGDEFCLPVYFSAKCPDIALPEPGFTIFKILFEKPLLDVNYIEPGEILSSEFTDGGYEYTIQVPNSVLNGPEPLLTQLCGQIIMNGISSSEITVRDAEFSVEAIFSAVPGLLRTGSCVAELRRLKLFHLTDLKVFPNPAGEKITLEIISEEQGAHSVTISGIEGRVIYESAWTAGENSPLEKTLQIDAAAFEQGIYFIRYESPWNVIGKKISVVK